MKNILSLFISILLCSCTQVGMEGQLVKELRKSGRRVVSVSNVKPLRSFPNCYHFEAQFEPGERTGMNVGGVPTMYFTVLFKNGTIMKGIEDLEGLMSTEVEVCKE